MTEGTIRTECPAMAVRQTLKGLAGLFRPFAPRITDYLPSPSMLTIGGPSVRVVSWEFDLVFPPTLVNYNKTGRKMWLPLIDPFGEPLTYPDWILEKNEAIGEGLLTLTPDLIVEAVRAYVDDRDNPDLWIDYAEECSVFDDQHAVFALPCDGIGYGKLPDGRQVKIYSQLPICEGRPQGAWWQWRKDWEMEAVTVRSRVVLV